MKCVHCLQELIKKSKDHVFPSSWFTDNTPASVQRWTVPSCPTCNGTFGEQEKELFIRLAICIDPTKAEASGIAKNALKSLGVGVKNIEPEERDHRMALRKRILAETRPFGQTGDLTLMPGLELHPGFTAEQQRAVMIPYELLKRVCGKVLRGCEYKLGNKRYIEDPYHLEIYFVRDRDIKDATSVFETIRPVNLGPGFEVRRGETLSPERRVVLYRLMIWGTIKIYASVGKEEDLAELTM